MLARHVVQVGEGDGVEEAVAITWNLAEEEDAPVGLRGVRGGQVGGTVLALLS